jgi:archaellum biogenesis ATPase FlaH
MAVVANVNTQIKTIRLPTYLEGLRGYLAWGGQNVPNEKIPQYISGGYRRGIQGSEDDRARLATFNEAVSHVARTGLGGLSLALLDDFNLCAADFDNVVDANGVITPWVEALVAGTYAEFSPSGKGIRAFWMNDGTIKDLKTMVDGRSTELFCEKGAVRLSGRPIDQTHMLDCMDTVAPVTDQVRQLYKEHAREFESDNQQLSNERLGATLEQAREALSHIPIKNQYAYLFPIGMALRHEFGDEAFELWNEWRSKDVDNYPGRAKLWQKWTGFKKQNGSVVTFRHILKLANEAGASIFISNVASIEDFQELVNAPSDDKPARFNLTQAADYINRKSANWIIKGLLPQGELVVIYGEPGSGKSFFGSELGLAISRGDDWRGRRVKKGTVVYVAAEGAAGFAKRLKAYAHVHQVDLKTLDFYVIDGTPNLLNKEDAVELTKSIKQTCEPSVIFIDTLAQTTPGANENSAEDMGAAIAHCKAIHKATGALVVLIHHSGKDATKGARGWSGLRGAVETEILVARLQVGRYATVRKQKDGEDGGVFGFDLEVVPVGMDEDGEVITSCVVKEINSPVATSQKKVFGKWEQMIIDEAKAQLKTGVTVTVDDVIDAIYDTLEPLPDDKRDQRKATMRRAMTNLSTDSQSPLMVTDGGLEWIGADD